MSFWDFDQPDEPPKYSRDVSTLIPVKLSFQQKLALKRQYSKLKKRESQLLQHYRPVPKPVVSQQDANSQLMQATLHFNRLNRHKKIPSTQDDLQVKKAAKNVIKWNLYNLYRAKKTELEMIQNRIYKIMAMLE